MNSLVRTIGSLALKRGKGTLVAAMVSVNLSLTYLAATANGVIEVLFIAYLLGITNMMGVVLLFIMDPEGVAEWMGQNGGDVLQGLFQGAKE